MLPAVIHSVRVRETDFVMCILQLLWLGWLRVLQKQGVKFVISVFWDCHNINLANLVLRDKRWSLKKINAVMMVTAIMLFAGAKENIKKPQVHSSDVFLHSLICKDKGYTGLKAPPVFPKWGISLMYDHPWWKLPRKQPCFPFISQQDHCEG